MLKLLVLTVLIVIVILSEPSNFSVQNLIRELQVESVARNQDGVLWVRLVDAQGQRLILEERELKDSHEVWNQLQKGQIVILHHRISSWKPWGKNNFLTWRHNDTLRIKKPD